MSNLTNLAAALMLFSSLSLKAQTCDQATLNATLALVTQIEAQLWATPNAEANNGSGTHSLLDIDSDTDALRTQLATVATQVSQNQGLLATVLVVSVVNTAMFIGVAGYTCWKLRTATEQIQ